MQWRGVPYAAAPTGSRRFLPPQPVPPWDGVRDASRFGSAAPQFISPLHNVVGDLPARWREDCLFLNVFAPADAEAPCPVMVWIHGGAFIGGSGAARWYDGGRFAAGGAVVVVTLNYRLGALGFLDLAAAAGSGDYRAAGNCGILDQLAALQWIQDNIAAFGGDPGRVTVFGESAGAMSIGAMLAMPAARGLFHGAILQSGAASAVRTKEESERITRRFLTAFGGSIDDLLAAPAERILDAQAVVTEGSDLTSSLASSLAFGPVVDGIDIPRPPEETIAAGDGVDIPVLIGTNRDEMSLFLPVDTPPTDMSDADVDRRVAAMIGARRWDTLGQRYRAANPRREAAALLLAVATDMVFRIPAVRIAEGMAAQHDEAPVWMYRFDWPSPAAGGRLGATHGLDVPFMWDLLDIPGVELFTGAAPRRHQLAKAMHSAWLAFATTGDPGTPLLPDWPRYQPPSRATMIFDAECRLAEDPDGAERQAWDALGRDVENIPPDGRG